MNEAEFLALPPRERDAMVAKSLFGVQIEWRQFAGGSHPYVLRVVGDEALQDGGCPTCGYDGHWDAWDVPEFSTDIIAAWTVVEKMREEDDVTGPQFERVPDGESLPIPWAFTLTVNPFWHEGPQWVAGWRQASWKPVFYPPNGEADTAPLAICLAALKAKGVVE